MAMKAADVERVFGISKGQLDEWESDASRGVLHGEPRGEVVKGRPLMFGQEMRQVGFKEPLDKVSAIDERANQLGLRRSEYLRSLVDADLKLAGIM